MNSKQETYSTNIRFEKDTSFYQFPDRLRMEYFMRYIDLLNAKNSSYRYRAYKLDTKYSVLSYIVDKYEKGTGKFIQSDFYIVKLRHYEFEDKIEEGYYIEKDVVKRALRERDKKYKRGGLKYCNFFSDFTVAVADVEDLEFEWKQRIANISTANYSKGKKNKEIHYIQKDDFKTTRLMPFKINHQQILWGIGEYSERVAEQVQRKYNHFNVFLDENELNKQNKLF